MLPLPQHPIHYLVGSTVFAPYVYEAWIHEKLDIKIRLFAFYLLSMLSFALVTPGSGVFDMAGIYLMVLSIMSIPGYMISDMKGIANKASQSFFDSILAYHSFFLMFFVLFNVSILLSGFFGGFTVTWSNTTMALGMMMMSGCSLQMAWTRNKNMPWSVVWFFSFLLGFACLWIMS